MFPIYLFPFFSKQQIFYFLKPDFSRISSDFSESDEFPVNIKIRAKSERNYATIQNVKLSLNTKQHRKKERMSRLQDTLVGGELMVVRKKKGWSRYEHVLFLLLLLPLLSSVLMTGCIGEGL